MHTRSLGALVALAAVVVSCTSEATRPIDLDDPAPTQPPVTGQPALPDDDPNAASRNQVIELAKEECRKDPTREFGVIIIADPDGVEVNRFEYPCADLENDDAAGGDE